MATKDVGNLRTRLSWEEDTGRGLQGFKDDLKGLRSEMNVARSSGLEYTQSLKGMREQSDILSRQFKTQQAQVAELKKRYDESVKTKGEDDKATRKLSDQYNNAVAAMNRTEQQLDAITKSINEQINPWKNLSKSMDDAGTKMQDIGKGMTDFGKSYSMRVTAPIVATSAAVFKLASDFESSFADVAKVLDGTEEEMSGLRQGIRDMAMDIPVTTTEIARVAAAAGQLGIEIQHIESFSRVMLDLGVATNMGSDEAATALARLANITGMSANDYDRLGATIVALGNSLATTEREIVEMSLRLAGAGKQVGLTEADILAFAGSLSSVGKQKCPVVEKSAA